MTQSLLLIWELRQHSQLTEKSLRALPIHVLLKGRSENKYCFKNFDANKHPIVIRELKHHDVGRANKRIAKLQRKLEHNAVTGSTLVTTLQVVMTSA